jgi:hypothetical protein
MDKLPTHSIVYATVPTRSKKAKPASAVITGPRIVSAKRGRPPPTYEASDEPMPEQLRRVFRNVVRPAGVPRED